MAKLVGRIPANRVKVSDSWFMPTLDADKVIKASGLTSAGRFPDLPSRSAEQGSIESTQACVPTSEQNDTEHRAELVDDSDGQDSDSGGTDGEGKSSQVLDNQKNKQTKSQPAVSTSPDVTESAAPLIEDAIAVEQNYSEGYLQGQKEGFAEGEKAGFLQGEQAGETAGYQAGIQKGLAEGAAKAAKAFELEITEKRKLFESILNIRPSLEKINEELEIALVPLVTGIAEAVLNVELETRPELIRTYVTESLKAMPHTTETVELAIHPDAVPFMAELPMLDQWHVKIVEDTTLTMGGCKVSSSHSAIDQTLSQRLRDCLLTVFGSDTNKETIRALTSEAKLNDLGRFVQENIPPEMPKIDKAEDELKDQLQDHLPDPLQMQVQAQDGLARGNDVETPE